MLVIARLMHFIRVLNAFYSMLLHFIIRNYLENYLKWAVKQLKGIFTYMYIKKKTTKLQAFHARKQLVKLVELFEVEDNFTSNRIYEK